MGELVGMCLNLIVILFTVNVVPGLSDVNIPGDVTADVQLTASPGEMHAGFTSHLNVTCAFHNDVTSNFNSLMSILLYKTSTLENTVYTEIASLSSASPDHVTVKNGLGAQVTGHLSSTNGMSYITFQWTYPGDEAKGEYKCEAFGMDSTGHPMVSSAATEVIDKTIDLDAILEKMRVTELLQKNQLDHQSSQLHNLQSQVNDLNSRLGGALNATFSASANFGNHTYFLSRVVMRDFAVHASMCRVFGGHLVEIDDKTEHAFIASFLNNNSVSVYTEIGATDVGHEGSWTYLTSGSPVTYIDWYPGQPSKGSRGQCMFLDLHDVARRFHDGDCISEAKMGRYICEHS